MQVAEILGDFGRRQRRAGLRNMDVPNHELPCIGNCRLSIDTLRAGTGAADGIGRPIPAQPSERTSRPVRRKAHCQNLTKWSILFWKFRDGLGARNLAIASRAFESAAGRSGISRLPHSAAQRPVTESPK
ncbi:MAG: hypothetical protein HY269_02815 [Deltaproteobacteria bacterium]|nr:hypothetical protein [Deltaproteobacteria bacterium]